MGAKTELISHARVQDSIETRQFILIVFLISINVLFKAILYIFFFDAKLDQAINALRH